MIYGSVCSGIEAASVAWNPLGWRSAFHRSSPVVHGVWYQRLSIEVMEK